jgi:DnaK suppressor protein
MKTKATVKTTTTRIAALRELLLGRRRELQSDVSGRVRTSRAATDREVGDMLDSSDADVQSGMNFTLLQMKTEMLANIGQALNRLDAGNYGQCIDCDEEIAERRLRAIPFAVRCQSCEQRLEGGARRHSDVATARFEPEVASSGAWRS